MLELFESPVKPISPLPSTPKKKNTEASKPSENTKKKDSFSLKENLSRCPRLKTQTDMEFKENLIFNDTDERPNIVEHPPAVKDEIFIQWECIDRDFCLVNRNKKIESIRKGQNSRQTARSVLLDHSYSTSYTSSSFKPPDLSNLIHEGVVDKSNVNITSDNSWRHGRRVVELGVLADDLAACKQYGLPLSLQKQQRVVCLLS
ncbi:unnamed protein product [Mytilus coruscus]|uniref:Uncharacterized protein n=1 Tax=Mytilus coruscus TaxID=42192 RepID=A0A6J8E4H6_MYTCO|nr:unnamed protein product [Mytilus coruscus]